MPADRDALAELHQRLADQLAELTSGDDWLAFLQASRQFHRYSPQNQMLLLLQGAEGHVASYRTWQRIPAQGGGTCQVRKGEHGLVVLAPMTIAPTDTDPATGEEIAGRPVVRFKPVKVFHQGQLVAPPAIVTPPLPRLLRGENRHQHVWAAVQSRVEERGFTVDKVTRSPVDTWNGRTHFGDRSVDVSDHLEPPAALKTLLHEWAHIVLAHDARLAGRPDLREVEAESVAYVLCGTIGLNSADYSVPYLASWSGGDTHLLQDTAQAALAAAATMIGELEHELSIDLTPDLINATTRTRDNDHVPPEHGTDGAHPRIVDPDPPPNPPPPPGPPGPLLERSAAELHTAMAALMTDGERHQLSDALADLDHKLATALELFANAGLESPSIARILTDRGVSPDRLVPAMIRDEIDHHPSHPHIPADEIQRIAADVRATVEPLRAVPEHLAPPGRSHEGLLGAGDQVLIDRLTRTGHLTEAARVLADAGLDPAQTRAVLRAFDVADTQIDATIATAHYNPATGRTEPLWPTRQPPGPTGPEESVSAARPPHDVIQRIAATANPIRLVHLNEAYGLNTADSIHVWADAGLAPDVIASAAIAAHDGNLSDAVDDLQSSWHGEPVDWLDIAASIAGDVPTGARLSTADAILA